MNMQYESFNESIVYDPDIRFQYAFELDEPTSNLAWIAAIVVGGVAAAAVIALIASPKLRSAVLPFKNRSSHEAHLNGLSTKHSSQASPSSGGGSGWSPSSRAAVTLSNVHDA
jgi:hypothetical protein